MLIIPLLVTALALVERAAAANVTVKWVADDAVWPGMSGVSSSLVVDKEGTVYMTSPSLYTSMAAIASNGTVKWSRDNLDMPNDWCYAPALSADQSALFAFVGLSAFSTATGAALWSVRLAGHAYDGPTLSADGSMVLAVETYEEQYPALAYAIDPKTGTLLWSTQVSGAIFQPASSLTTVFVPSRLGALWALDLHTGAVLWHYQSNGTMLFRPVVDPEQGTVYFCDDTDSAYALSPSGQLLWQTSHLGMMVTTPLLWQGRLYFHNRTGVTYALDTATGAVVWQQQRQWRPDLLSRPVINPVDRTVLFVSSIRTLNGVFAVDADTGEDKWQMTLPPKGEYWYQSPAVGPDGTVYVVHKALYALQVEY